MWETSSNTQDDLEAETVKQIKKHSKWFVLVILAVLLCGFLSSSIYSIDEGTRGVILRNGRITQIADPGLGFKIPMIDSVVIISTRNESLRFGPVGVYSHDQQPASLQVSVSFHVPANEVQKLYTQYGSIENLANRVIARQVPTQAENIFGQYTAISVIKDRVKFVNELSTAIKTAVADTPVVIDSVQVENIDFSDAYEKSVEARMTAEVTIATRKQNLETEKVDAEITVTKAKAQADSQLAVARAEAEAFRLRGEAEAESIKARGEALRQNPQVIQLTTAQSWDGKLPYSMIPGSTVPFINVSPVQ